MAATELQTTVLNATPTRFATKTVEHRTATIQIRYLAWGALAFFLSGFILSEWSDATADAAEKEKTVITQPASAEGKATAPK
jgi:hypothetical protein